jgi:arginine-tRNA-protein transferase
MSTLSDTILEEFITQKEPCSYLQNKQQQSHYKIIENCSKSFSHELLERGWRRFGKMFFHPVCEGCDECKSLKIDAKNYIFSKSNRRLFRKNSNTSIHIRKPSVTIEHLQLFDKYHRAMKEKKSWKYDGITTSHYYASFVDGAGDFGHEVLYFEQKRLIGVDLIDISHNGISSIYFFYDPDFSHLSLGTYSLLKQIEFAKKMDLEWIYTGYYVQDCSSLAYKSNFRPHKILEGRPKLFEEYAWR